MGAIFSQKGDKLYNARGLGGEYSSQMVTSQQVREALRQLRTDAKLDPEGFADEAGVNRATVYRIEKMEKSYAPRVDTVSALVESRGLTMAAFFAKIEGVKVKGRATDRETEKDVQMFVGLPPSLRAAALTWAIAIREHQQPALPDESPHEHPQGRDTKLGAGRRR